MRQILDEPERSRPDHRFVQIPVLLYNPLRDDDVEAVRQFREKRAIRLCKGKNDRPVALRSNAFNHLEVPGVGHLDLVGSDRERTGAMAVGRFRDRKRRH